MLNEITSIEKEIQLLEQFKHALFEQISQGLTSKQQDFFIKEMQSCNEEIIQRSQKLKALKKGNIHMAR